MKYDVVDNKHLFDVNRYYPSGMLAQTVITLPNRAEAILICIACTDAFRFGQAHAQYAMREALGIVED